MIAKSIVIYGCSGGGDLALEIAAATDVAAIAPEEPATVLFSGTGENSGKFFLGCASEALPNAIDGTRFGFD